MLVCSVLYLPKSENESFFIWEKYHHLFIDDGIPLFVAFEAAAARMVIDDGNDRFKVSIVTG